MFSHEIMPKGLKKSEWTVKCIK